jgi:hypothetical protein
VSTDRSLGEAAASSEETGALARLEGDGERPAGIEGSGLPGPFPVGAYAVRLRDLLVGGRG